jgi:hypothetical protein
MNKKNQAPKNKALARLPLGAALLILPKFNKPKPLKIAISFYQDAVVLSANRKAFFSSVVAQFQKFAPVLEVIYGENAQVSVNDFTKRRLRRHG